jgi:outer membrane protein OmpA-like peptidoglycan-associated protein
MNKLIEVEIENKSYMKLLDIDRQQSNILKLTTLEDNQSAVIIKVFFNNSDTRIVIKEFNVQNLKPKASGLPRFELKSSYNNKILYLDLLVDGKKFEHISIKLNKYLRNKLLPLYIFFGIILAFLLFFGGKLLISSSIFNNRSTSKLIDSKTEITKVEIKSPEPTNTSVQSKNNKEKPEPAAEILSEEITNVIEDKPEQTVIELSDEKTDILQEQSEPVIKTIQVQLTAYFTPNNSSIQKDTALELSVLAKKLKNNPEAVVEISGYCAMTGNSEGRDRLSRERAFNVLSFLKNEGWLPETEPVVKWYGGSKPVTNIESEIYKNRRVEIKIQ